jgi:hypothetical protein
VYDITRKSRNPAMLSASYDQKVQKPSLPSPDLMLYLCSQKLSLNEKCPNKSDLSIRNDGILRG